MRLVCISDTHTKHKDLGKLPDGDVLIHAGDWTYRGSCGEIKDFLEWFDDQPHKHKILIAGNHEFTLDRVHPNYDHSLRAMVVNRSDGTDATYLEDSSVVIDGIKFYGSPASPAFKGWGFGVERGAQAERYWQTIPGDTNVLITHGPGYGILDTSKGHVMPDGDPHLGCYDLSERIEQLADLKLHVFGHIHDSSGIMTHYCDFVNAACCNEAYKIANPPRVIDIFP